MYIIKINRLTDVGKDSIKEQVVAHIQRNECVTRKMNVINYEPD